MLVNTQWRLTPVGGVIGLDYAAVRSAVCLAQLNVTPDMFDGLRVMEDAAVEALNKKHG